MNPPKLSSIGSIAFLILAGTTSVHAEENHFVGGYAVITDEWKSASVKIDGEKINKHESAPSVGLGYNFGVGQHGTFGIKATFDAKKGEYGVGEVSGKETEVKEKSHYSIALEPGYAFNDKLLGFGILAYHHATAELVQDAASKGSSGVTGYGYGVGAKYVLADHIFLIAEVQKVNYQSKKIDGFEIKPSSTVTALGIGYHF